LAAKASDHLQCDLISDRRALIRRSFEKDSTVTEIHGLKLQCAAIRVSKRE